MTGTSPLLANPAADGPRPALRAPGPNETNEATNEASALSSDFETFLRMLTVQVQNQDPLNPLDSTDFAVQLATFSGVEQQVLTNDLLGGLSNAIGGNDLAQIAGWIGMDARAAAPAVFAGDPVLLEPSAASAATRAELRVFDESGVLWDRFDIPVQSGPVLWEGRRADGSVFPDGIYTFDVASFDEEGTEIDVSTAQTYNRVVEARIGQNGPDLLLGNGSFVSADTITALRGSPPNT